LNKSQFDAVRDNISHHGTSSEVITDDVEIQSESAVQVIPSNCAAEVDLPVVSSCPATTHADVPSSTVQQGTLSHPEEDANVTKSKPGVHCCTDYFLNVIQISVLSALSAVIECTPD